MQSFRTPFLSLNSANALISDLRPATLSPAALQLVNDFLDEILFSLIRHAGSLNPIDLRASGVPAVFSGDKAAGESTGPRTLGRAAVGEAELELRSWQSSRPRGAKTGFADGQGSGIKGNRAFPSAEAGEFMRVKCATYSTLAPQDGVSKQIEDEAYKAWEAVDGETGEETVGPAGLWLTAILEFVCEHVLGQLSRVIARDSSISIAGPQDLYVALCEDESVWGMFRRMQVKATIETAVQTTRSRKISGRSDQLSSSATSSSLGRRAESPSSLKRSASLANPDVHASPGTIRRSAATSGIADSAAVSRYGAGLTGGPSPKDKQKTPVRDSQGHQRSTSALSSGTKSLIAAFNDQRDGRASPVARARSPVQDDADEFDAMIASVETKKISLTPSRLKTFESQGRRTLPNSPSNLATSKSASASPEKARLPTSASMSGLGSRVTSAPQRLQARSPTTIDETSDDGVEETPARSNKESLAELLASEPGEAKANARESPQKTSGTGRTAPAIILGTPPPPADSAVLRGPSTQSTPKARLGPIVPSPPKPNNGPTLNRPHRNLDADDDLDVGEQAVRKKTSAQELADFLNSAPPALPPTGGENGRNGSIASAKPKTLRGFISKIGRKKSEDHNLSPLLPPSSSMRSLGPVADAPSSARQAGGPTLFQGIGSNSLARPRSQDDRAMGGKAAVTLGGGAAVLGAAAAGAGISRAPEKDSVPEVTSNTQSGMSVPADGSVSRSDGDFTPAQSASNLTDHSDARSFATAEEPSSASDLPADAADNSPAVASTGTAVPSPPPPTPPPKPNVKSAAPVVADALLPTAPEQPKKTSTPASIPLDQVAVLRRLLQHAETADECRMLVGAMLAQWGATRSAQSGEEEVEPEHRVLAWLLGGAQGPPVSTVRENGGSASQAARQSAASVQTAVSSKPLMGLGISQSGVPT